MKSRDLKKTKRLLVLVLVALLLVLADQIFKAVAELMLAEKADVVLIPDWLWLTYSENPGAAFSSFSDDPTVMLVITYLTPVLVAAFIALALTVFKKNVPAQAALFVISAGAIGNFLDRILFTGILPGTAGEAAVRDFVGLKFFNVCNLADFCITLGAVAFLFIILFIGPQAVIPLTKKWRQQAKEEDAKK